MKYLKRILAVPFLLPLFVMIQFGNLIKGMYHFVRYGGMVEIYGEPPVTSEQLKIEIMQIHSKLDRYSRVGNR